MPYIAEFEECGREKLTAREIKKMIQESKGVLVFPIP
jgi:hypothetical protein